jgi:hypothetical protein
MLPGAAAQPEVSEKQTRSIKYQLTIANGWLGPKRPIRHEFTGAIRGPALGSIVAVRYRPRVTVRQGHVFRRRPNCIWLLKNLI